jgi:hypothetical protein
VSQLKKLDLIDPELEWLETQVRGILDAKKLPDAIRFYIGSTSARIGN